MHDAVEDIQDVSISGIKTVAARGLVNGRGPRRSRGRDSVFYFCPLPQGHKTSDIAK